MHKIKNRVRLTYPLPRVILSGQGETPITKNAAVTAYPTSAPQEVSQIKNITVVDTQGRQYEATYPKRAKGLVKKGRARFVDETTICLARPPYHTEDEMENHKNAALSPEGENQDVQLDTAYVIAKIEQIMAESQHLRKALDILTANPMSGEAVIGIGNMIEARERTNQEMISLLKHILNAHIPNNLYH